MPPGSFCFVYSERSESLCFDGLLHAFTLALLVRVRVRLDVDENENVVEGTLENTSHQKKLKERERKSVCVCERLRTRGRESKRMK